MKSHSFANFQLGMVDDPSVEDQGGFEFASGMDIFSEPGVMKASLAMQSVTLGGSVGTLGQVFFMRETTDASNIRGYIIAGDKVLESTDGTTWNLFLTNANGIMHGLGIWNGYVMYAADTKLGRAPVGDGASKDDNYATIDSDTEWHPMEVQAGTLKIGAGRYVASLDESFALTAQALKLAVGYRVKSLAEYFRKLYAGTRFAALTGDISIHDATTFDWNGTVLASGSALPDNPFPLRMRGMNSLFASSEGLLGFPDRRGDIYRFNGAEFVAYRRIPLPPSASGTDFRVDPGAVHQHIDTVIFGGVSFRASGVYQMKNGALCEAFVPTTMTPGTLGALNIQMVRSAFNGRVLIGYNDGSTNRIEISHASNRQNNAMMRTCWHRIGTDKFKRWGGVKLNLKPLAASTSVAVAYRTARDAAFTDSGYTITSSNQDKPVLFLIQPRSKEIQYKFTYTTATSNTPELISYDPIHEVLNTHR